MSKFVTSLLIVLLLSLAALLAIYRVEFAPEFAWPDEREVPDQAVEARFAACFAEQDRAIHETAFGTIDNPDVQREYIATQRDAARNNCRLQHPARLETVRTPLRIRVFRLERRH